MGANDEYKDRVFKYLFGNPANREWTLALYNAVNGSNYENAEEIEYNTIEDAVYLGILRHHATCAYINIYDI